MNNQDDMDIPDFMKETQPKQDPFFTQPPAGSVPSGVVFVFESVPEPEPVGGPSSFEPNALPQLNQEELFGLYVTTNAMLNILVSKRLITQEELTKHIKAVKDALDKRK